MKGFLPLDRIIERVENSKADSGTAYFYDLILLSEGMIKTTIAALLAGMKKDTLHLRDGLYHKITRAESLGVWSEVMNELMKPDYFELLNESIRQNEASQLKGPFDTETWQYSAIREVMAAIKIIAPEGFEDYLPKKIPFVSWFHKISELRNKSRGHGAPTEPEFIDAAKALRRSLNLVYSNFELFNRPWAHIFQKISGTYKVTELSSNCSAFNILREEKGMTLRNGVYIYLDGFNRVDLIESTSDAIDFFFPNGNFKDKTFESISFFTGDRRFIDNSPYLTPPYQLPESITAGSDDLKVVGEVFGNIPPFPEDYISREGLQNILIKELRETDTHPIVTLHGRGGIGKTSLALKVLERLVNEKVFELIFWLSSRDIDLFPDRIKVVRPQILDEDDVAEEFTKLLNPAEVINGTMEPIEFLNSNMKKSHYDGPILFVFDNFETVNKPVEFYKWIDTFIRVPNKVLITSRVSKDFRGDYPIEVKGMNERECLELINKTTIKLGIEKLITDEYKESLIQESAGHPYVIKVLLGQVSTDGKISAIPRIVAGRDDVLETLFRRTFDNLPRATKRVFLTLCSWRSVIPELALQSILLRQENPERIEVGESIEELRRNSFIEVLTSDKDETRFINVPLVSFVFGSKQLKESPDFANIHSDSELIQDFGACQISDIKNGFEPRMERKLKSIESRVSNGESLQKHLPSLEFIANNYPKGWLVLSRYFKERKNWSTYETQLRNFLTYCPTPNDKIPVYRELALHYRRGNKKIEEYQCLVRMCSVSTVTFETISNVAFDLRNELRSQKFLAVSKEQKGKLVKDLAEIMEARIEREGFTRDYRNLAWLFYYCSEPEKCERYASVGENYDLLDLLKKTSKKKSRVGRN